MKPILNTVCKCHEEPTLIKATEVPTEPAYNWSNDPTEGMFPAYCSVTGEEIKELKGAE